MSHEELKKLETEADKLERQGRTFSNGAEHWAEKRKSGKKLHSIICDLVWYHGQRGTKLDDSEEGAIFIAELENIKHDLLRIVEMKLAAKARDYKTQAKAKRAIIDAAVLPFVDPVLPPNVDIEDKP